MDRKKLVKSVKVYADSHGDGVLAIHTVGLEDVVNIQIHTQAVQIYFRAEGDEQKTKMEDRPYKFYSGFRFIVEEV
jgi:hypothetical protein